MILIPTDKPQPTRGDYLLIGDRCWRVLDDGDVWMLAWLTLELAKGRGWKHEAPQIDVLCEIRPFAA